MTTTLAHRLTLLTVAALLLAALAPLQAAENNGYRSLFNGEDLTDWDGNLELWSVQDGCITGTTTGPEQLTYNQFLIWRGGVVKNFELRAKIRQSGNNSGIQYRSKENRRMVNGRSVATSATSTQPLLTTRWSTRKGDGASSSKTGRVW